MDKRILEQKIITLKNKLIETYESLTKLQNAKINSLEDPIGLRSGNANIVMSRDCKMLYELVKVYTEEIEFLKEVYKTSPKEDK